MAVLEMIILVYSQEYVTYTDMQFWRNDVSYARPLPWLTWFEFNPNIDK